MFFIAFTLSAAVVSVAKGVKAEVDNASVGIIDNDYSTLSMRLRDAIMPPYFKAPQTISHDQIDGLMDKGDVIFVLDIPANFEEDLLAGRQPKVQLLVDATAMTQAGVGVFYFQQIFTQEVLGFLNMHGIDPVLPVQPIIRLFYNPNTQSAWFTSVMHIVMTITILGIILVGAAVIREREHGTIEHLLVMPVRASEIACAKILTNAAVILVASLLSIALVAHLGLGVPIHGSWLLFALGTAIFLFSVTALGMFLATLAPNMPQFGLLASIVILVLYLLSGAATPLESMPITMQYISQIFPTTQYVALAQNILFRGAGFPIVWSEFAAMAFMGLVFMTLALGKFRSMLAQQG
jgi:ABC-2 type transport system permease protein